MRMSLQWDHLGSNDPIHLGMYISEFYCNLTLFLTVFGVGYLYTGSMIIAIFRVLYIKYGRWMQTHNGVFASIFPFSGQKLF